MSLRLSIIRVTGWIAPRFGRAPGQGDVDRVGREPAAERFRAQLSVAFLPGGGQCLLERVAGATGDRTFFRRQRTEAAEKAGKFSFRPEVGVLPRRRWRRRRWRPPDRPGRAGADRRGVVERSWTPLGAAKLDTKKPLGRDEGPPRGTTLLRRSPARSFGRWLGRPHPVMAGHQGRLPAKARSPSGSGENFTVARPRRLSVGGPPSLVGATTATLAPSSPLSLFSCAQV